MSSGLSDLLAAAPGLTLAQLLMRVPADVFDVDRELGLEPGTIAKVRQGARLVGADDVRLAAWLQKFAVELDPEPWWVWVFGLPLVERRGPTDNGMRMFVRCRCGNAFLGGGVANVGVKQTRSMVTCSPWKLDEAQRPLGVVWYSGRALTCSACGKGGPWRPQAVILCDDRLRLE